MHSSSKHVFPFQSDCRLYLKLPFSICWDKMHKNKLFSCMVYISESHQSSEVKYLGIYWSLMLNSAAPKTTSYSFMQSGSK